MRGQPHKIEPEPQCQRGTIPQDICSRLPTLVWISQVLWVIQQESEMSVHFVIILLCFCTFICITMTIASTWLCWRMIFKRQLVLLIFIIFHFLCVFVSFTISAVPTFLSCYSYSMQSCISDQCHGTSPKHIYYLFFVFYLLLFSSPRQKNTSPLISIWLAISVNDKFNLVTFCQCSPNEYSLSVDTGHNGIRAGSGLRIKLLIKSISDPNGHSLSQTSRDCVVWRTGTKSGLVML